VTVEVAVIGIDGSGKSSIILRSAAHLGTDHSIVILGWKSVAYIEQGRTCYLLKLITGSCHGFVQRVGFVLKRIRIAWLRLRKAALIKRLTPVICIEDRDLVLDPCILAVLYVPAIKKTSVSVRIRFMKSMVRGRLSDAYVYLDISPETAFERVCLRHRQEDKKLSAHENLQHLSQLRYEYESALAFLQDCHIPVCRVNTEDCSMEECSQKIVDFLERHIQGENEMLTPIDRQNDRT
jgi:thymidylate kinase